MEREGVRWGGVAAMAVLCALLSPIAAGAQASPAPSSPAQFAAGQFAAGQFSATPAPPIPSAETAVPTPDLPTPDLQAKAYLFGAAYARSDLSPDKAGGMMFLPGRGLIRWETQGRSQTEIEELKTEAVGLADARAVQAEIDAQHDAVEAERARAAEAMEMHQNLGLAADARTVTGLAMNPVTGTRRQAGGVVALNHAAVQAGLADRLGVREGARFKDRSRVYLFGAVSGRGVGMNLMHDAGGGWRNAGLSTDKGGFVGQRQAGLALRKGPAQMALSYVQEKTRAQILGITAIKDHRAMLNFTFVPKFAVH